MAVGMEVVDEQVVLGLIPVGHMRLTSTLDDRLGQFVNALLRVPVDQGSGFLVPGRQRQINALL